MPTSCLKSNLSQVLRFLIQQRKFTICPTQLHWISLRVSTHLRIVQVLIVNTPWIISSFLRCSHSAWFSFWFIIYFLYQVWFLCLQVYFSIYITQWLSIIKELMQLSVLSNFTTLPLPPPRDIPCSLSLTACFPPHDPFTHREWYQTWSQKPGLTHGSHPPPALHSYLLCTIMF